MSSDQRRSVRMKTFLKGRISFNGGASTMDCLIRDLSSVGARLELSQTSAIPEVFELYVPNRDRTLRATLCWRRDNGVGVTFDAPNEKPVPVSANEPAQPADPSMAILLRRISELEAENTALRSVLASIGQNPTPSAA